MDFDNNSNRRAEARDFILFLGFPFSLVDYLRTLIVLFSIIAFVYIILDDFENWWQWELPKKDEDLLKRKSFFFVFVYRIRCYSYRKLWEAYVERLYEAFLIFLIALMFGLYKPILILWRWYFNPQRKQRIYERFVKLSKRLRYISIYLYFCWYFEHIVRIPYLVLHSKVAYTIYNYIYISVCSLPLYAYIFSILFILSVLWLIIYKSFNILVFNLFKLNGLEFPRLAISSRPQGLKSTFDFKHKEFNTNPIEVRLKSLVGFNYINVWSPKFELERYILWRRRRRKILRIRSMKIKNFPWFRIRKVKRKRYDIWKFPIVIGLGLLQSNKVKSRVIHSAQHLFRILLPRLVSSKLSSSTTVSKGLVLHNTRSIIKKKYVNYQLIANSKPKCLVLNPSVSEILPICSAVLHKKRFFMPQQFQSFVYNGKQHKEVTDIRFVRTFVSDPVLISKPTSFIRTNFNVVNEGYTNIVNRNFNSSVFLQKKRIFRTKKKKLELARARHINDVFDIRLRFLILKRRLHVLRDRVFSSHPFHSRNPFWLPNIVFRRKSVLLKKIFIVIRHNYIFARRGPVNKGFYKGVKYTQFFSFFLLKRRRFTMSDNLFVFLRQLYYYNYKFCIKHKEKRYNMLNPIPLIHLKNSPWWHDYTRLIQSSNFKTYYDGFDLLYNNKNLCSNYLKSDLMFIYKLVGCLIHHAFSSGSLSQLTVKTFPAVINNFYDEIPDEEYHLDDIFFLRHQERLMGFFNKLLSENKSYRTKYFFDFNLYSRKNSLSKILNFNRKVNKYFNMQTHNNEFVSQLSIPLLFLISCAFVCCFTESINALVFI